jgi:hypothetical protein
VARTRLGDGFNEKIIGQAEVSMHKQIVMLIFGFLESSLLNHYQVSRDIPSQMRLFMPICLRPEAGHPDLGT